MNFLAEDISDIFGEITPPQAMNFGGDDPALGLSNLISFGIRLFIIVAGMFLLLYLLWGAFDWISSGGEKEKITKAQNKITNALIGMVLIFAILVIFNVFAGNMLRIIEVGPNGEWSFKLPTLR
ncbi:MAG: pilin [Patescibacteria group bacterium]|nr:pilin [Patescibacteria group bacterium]